jgi:hypothetical protein
VNPIGRERRPCLYQKIAADVCKLVAGLSRDAACAAREIADADCDLNSKAHLEPRAPILREREAGVN